MSERNKSKGRVQSRKDIPRRDVGSFTYPFGVYPETDSAQEEGYDAKYLTEESCFFYQIVVSHGKILETVRELITLLPPKGFLVTKIHSEDFYQDHDTYISEESLDRDQFFLWLTQWQDVALDDGFFGVGFFAEGGGNELFLDEHKTINIYFDDPARVEAALKRLGIEYKFELKFFWDEPHYHEALPLDNDGYDYLTAFEDLADTYNLCLEEDEEENLDHAGDPIGVTCWKIEIRGFSPVSLVNTTPKGFYTTLYVNGSSRREVIEIAEEALNRWEEQVDLVLQMARVPVELLRTEMRAYNQNPDEPGVWHESERVFFDWSQP